MITFLIFLLLFSRIRYYSFFFLMIIDYYFVKIIFIILRVLNLIKTIFIFDEELI
jgi:hypothetical protein